MVDFFTQGGYQPIARPCTKLVSGSCSVLHAKCIEAMWWSGVKYGDCKIRVARVGTPPRMPSCKPAKPKPRIRCSGNSQILLIGRHLYVSPPQALAMPEVKET